jgi:DNA polymerase III delta subunit
MSRAEVFPVCIISGNEPFLRRRFRDGYIEAMGEQGWSLDWADADVPGQLAESLGAGMFMDETKTLVVVLNPHKGDLALYETHSKEKDPDTILALYFEGKPKGNTKWGKFVKAHSKTHRGFERPKDWDLPAYATQFVAEEVLEFGKRFGHPSLPGAIVEKVGTDLGVLHFELSKMVMLADSDVITVSNVKGAVAALSEVSIQPVINALARRDKKKLIKALERLKSTSRTDPTMGICRIVGGRAMQWFQAANLSALPPGAAAEELGINPWHFKNNILPVARKWGQPDLIRLIKALALSERAILGGHVSPWIGLFTRLLVVC